MTRFVRNVQAAARAAAIITAILFATTSITAQAATDARLVHCGTETCLRLSGNRQDAGVEVRVADHALNVDGGSHWRVIVPLAIARTWAISSGDMLPVVLVDLHSDAERTQMVRLPPGALGRKVELAAMVVSVR